MSIYDEEQKALNSRPKGGGGGDFTWLSLPTPASVGQATKKTLRVLQRLQKGPNGEPNPQAPFPKFWVRVEQHRLTIDGQVKMLVCPENKDDPNWRDHMTCPICILQKQLYDTRDEEMKKIARGLGSRTKCYANVIDLDDPATHWKDKGDGTYEIRPHVWGYGMSVHRKLIEICQNMGAIEDWQVGRNMIVSKKRTGPKTMNVEYSVMQHDRSQVPDNLMPVVARAWDLEGLATPATMDELQQAAMAVDPRTRAAGGGGYAPTTAAYGAPAAAAAGGYGGYGTPAPGGYGGAPASTPAAPAAPPVTPPPTAAPAPTPQPGPYTYQGPTGQHANLTAQTIAQHVSAGGQPQQHQVWAAGWPNWVQADQVPEVVTALQAMAPAPAAPAPQAPPAGPPASSYQPQGGYAVGGPPTTPAAPAMPAAPAAPPTTPPAGPPAAAAPPPTAAAPAGPPQGGPPAMGGAVAPPGTPAPPPGAPPVPGAPAGAPPGPPPIPGGPAF